MEGSAKGLGVTAAGVQMLHKARDWALSGALAGGSLSDDIYIRGWKTSQGIKLVPVS